MFPASHDALPLPPNPDIEQYKKLAKELVRICKSGDPAALDAWSRRWVDLLLKLTGLKPLSGWPFRPEQWAAQVAEFARKTLTGSADRKCLLADAQFVLARVHGFGSWTKFSRHLDELTHGSSSTSVFEAAADAIVEGEIETLSSLLRENPELIRARSSRDHHATLLHYAAANGVEGWRQKTPKNIVEIAKLLLNAGAEVDATAEMYGGECTTLGLAATSVHPERAGVQIALMQLLLDRGARMDIDDSAGNGQSLVKACLANGRGQAAAFLALRGAPLDLETACGVGAIDAVKGHFDSDGELKPDTNEAQLREGFLWACQFGRNRVVEFLLERGINLGWQDGTGQTALHHAVIGAQLETVKLLLKHSAPLEVKNSYGGTVLGQAVWSATNAPLPTPFLAIFLLLLQSGAKVSPDIEAAWAELSRGQVSKLKQR